MVRCELSCKTVLGLCSTPTVGSNVSVESYSSGVEGSQITYYCQPGLLPSEKMVANCTSDGTWSPDPAGHDCYAGLFNSSVPTTAVCRMPEALNNVMIVTTNWSSYNVLMFHCAEGFTPNNTVTSVCTSEGKWSPDPQMHICSKVQPCCKLPWPGSYINNLKPQLSS